MATEIERKFLIKDKTIVQKALTRDAIKQGYLTKNGAGNSVRVRVLNDVIGVVTIKGPTTNFSRIEVEYAIRIDEAKQLLSLCDDVVEKVRFEVKIDDKVWFIDKFSGLNQGLYIAEIELEDELEEFVRPDWLGDEVTYSIRYYNSNLAVDPFTLWDVNGLEIHRQGEQ